MRKATLWLLLLVIGCEPIGPWPGGALSGEVSPGPIDRARLGDASEYQLETRPQDPYSINVWGVVLTEGIYVAAGSGAGARWTQFLAEDPNVRLRVGTTLYPLSAVRVLDESELRAVRASYRAKYELKEDDTMATKAWVYRLDPRPPVQ